VGDVGVPKVLCCPPFGDFWNQHGRAGGRWQENRALRRLHFAYADRAAPLALARSLASELQRVPARDALLALHGVPQARPAAPQSPVRPCLVACTPVLSTPDCAKRAAGAPLRRRRARFGHA